MTDFDNTDLLNTVHEVQDLAQSLLVRLYASASTPSKMETVHRIRSVVEMQTKVIRRLTEQHLQMMDAFENLLKTLDQDDL